MVETICELEPDYILSDTDKQSFASLAKKVTANPYKNYDAHRFQVS